MSTLIVALLFAVFLFSATTVYASGSDEGTSSADDSHLRVRAEYSFSGFGTNNVEIRAEARVGDGSSERKVELRFEASVGSDGAKVRAEYRRDSNDNEARYRFKMFIKRIVEYIPDATPGFQKGSDQVVHLYGSPSSVSGPGWSWGNFVDVTPSTATDRQFSATTTDGVFTVSGKANPTPATVAPNLNVKLNDIKFDYSVDIDKLKALGFLNQTGTELAIIGVVQSRLRHRLCDDDNETAAACVNDVDGSLAGFVKWANELNCKVNGNDSGNLTVHETTVSSDDTEGDSELHTDGDRATVFAWSLKDPLSATGVCLWDPIVFIGSAQSMTTLSIVAIAAAIVAMVF